MPKTKTKKNLVRVLKHDLLLFIIFSLVLVASAAYVFKSGWHQPKANQTTYVGGRSDPANAYNNLDLRIAADASYSGSSILTVKDLGAARGVEHKIVRFDVHKDNLVESALMTLPSTPAPAGGYPVLILCHGYVNPLYYSTEKAYLYDMEFYSQNGFAVIKPDFRGQGLSIGAGSADGAYYSMAYNTDVMSLIADVKQTNKLNKNNINLWGHSMGAYVALRASVLSKDIKNAIILSGPVGNIQDMFNAYVAISDTNNATAAAVRSHELVVHGTPVTNPDYWNNTSPINFLSNSKTFYQIHTSLNDKVVPPQFSADLDIALTKADKSHEYYVYKNGDHGLWSLRSSIWQRSLARLNS